MSAPKALGVALVGAATVGVVVSLRYLVLAYLLRDRGVAVLAACALVVFGLAAEGGDHPIGSAGYDDLST